MKNRINDQDGKFCRELFSAYLRRYLDSPQYAKGNFLEEAIYEFHTRLEDGEISFAEFGCIVDMIVKYLG